MKFRRTHYLINPKFQLRVSFFISSLIFILSLAYPITIFTLFENLVKQSHLQETVDLFYDNRMKLITTLISYHLGYISIIFIITIIQGHKIAGPIYKLINFFNSVAKGGKIEKVQFRKDDHFQELAEATNKAFDEIKNTYNRDYAYLSEVSDYLKNIYISVPEDKKKVIEEIISKLSEIQEKFKPL